MITTFWEDIRIAVVIILFVGTWQWFKSWTGSSVAGFVIALIFTYLLWMKYFWFAMMAVMFAWGLGFFYAFTEIFE